MLEAGTYWKLVCDNCGPEGFAGDEIDYRLADSEPEARRLVEDNGGQIAPNGRVLCGSCIEDGAALADSTEGGRRS